MSLPTGTRLGPYEILALIGAGGMGEVYKAADTRLNRTVAVKVLPGHLSGNAELKQRFEREAQAIAALNHPNICVIHDVGHQDSIDYLVMEYIEGDSLADRLCKGPLPLDTTLRYAIEIIDALDKAHRHGIVHRDLKPGNIMLTKSGAKLLDFGLAKFRAEPLNTTPLSQLPTGPAALTGQGAILGTFQYMAPEQLEGLEADARTDVFAFGSVMYEMLTGKRAFEGRSHASLIAAILGSQPPRPSTLRTITPPALDYVVETCMAKDPVDRFQTAHDLGVQLKWIAAADSGVPKPVVVERKKERYVVWGAAVVAAAVLASLIIAIVNRSEPEQQRIIRATISLPADAPYFGGATLSPDGTNFVYRSLVNATPALRFRSLDRADVLALPGTEGGSLPFSSSDGQWIGFAAAGKLKKIPINGGGATDLGITPVARGLAWGPDNTIVAASGPSTGLVRIFPNGGQPQPVTKLETGELSHGWPVFLPAGRAILFAASLGGSWDDARIIAQSLDTGERYTVATGGSAPRYISTGHVLFARAGSIFAVPFDVKTLSPTGTPVAVLEGVSTSAIDGWADYWVSDNGTLVYLPSRPQAAVRSLVWVDRKGVVQPLPIPQRAFEEPRFSPDRQHVALTIRAGDADTWVLDVLRGTLTRLTFGGEEDESPIWTPDGKRIAFSSLRGGKRQTMWKSADGSGMEEVLAETESGRHHHLGSWTPNGEVLIADEQSGPTGFDIYITPIKKNEKPQPFLISPFVDASAQLSPDGRWLAYTSNESGRTEVFVQSFPDRGQRIQISTEGGEEPVWNPSGRELFYRTADKMMAVAVETAPGFKAGVPRMLFEGQFARIGWQRANYDVSRDGQRFLMIKGEEVPLATTFNLVLNWFTELSQRASAR